MLALMEMLLSSWNEAQLMAFWLGRVYHPVSTVLAVWDAHVIGMGSVVGTYSSWNLRQEVTCDTKFTDNLHVIDGTLKSVGYCMPWTTVPNSLNRWLITCSVLAMGNELTFAGKMLSYEHGCMAMVKWSSHVFCSNSWLQTVHVLIHEQVFFVHNDLLYKEQVWRSASSVDCFLSSICDWKPASSSYIMSPSTSLHLLLLLASVYKVTGMYRHSYVLLWCIYNRRMNKI